MTKSEQIIASRARAEQMAALNNTHLRRLQAEQRA